MGRINLLLTTSNGNLANKKEMIENAVKAAEEYVFPKLDIDWDIDLLVTNRLYNMIIPEDGVGGYTHASDFIECAIDEEKATANFISEILAHELCHAARWGKNDEWISSLFDGIINEGIATYFEAEFVKNREEKQFFIKTILKRQDKENEKILENLRDKLNSNSYDYSTLFFYGDDNLPRWSAYSLGSYLVKKYLEKTKKTIKEAFIDKYSDFRSILLT